MAARPLRCIGLAFKDEVGELATYDGDSHPAHKMLVDPSTFINLEQGMTFVGVAGIKDPARPEVPPAIAACETAGIRVVMITGDSPKIDAAVTMFSQYEIIETVRTGKVVMARGEQPT